MRKKLYRAIDSAPYIAVMVLTIIASIVPLAFREDYPVFDIIEKVSTALFLLDYAARWCTADLALPDRKMPFAAYPFSAMAMIDLISLLPSFTVLWDGLKLLRLVRILRVLRALKLARYSRSMQMIANVFREQRESLLTVCLMALAYILVSALIVYNVEPETFETFFEAVYWATISLTTMGYGDIYPVTPVGRLFTMLSSLLGIAIVALPAGIVTAGYMDEIRRSREKGEEEKEVPQKDS